LAAQQVGLFIATGAGQFNGNNVALFGQQPNGGRGAVVALVGVAPTYNSNGSLQNSVVQFIALRGDGASISTHQSIAQSITSTGSLGDLTLQGPLAGLSVATSIFGSLNVDGPLTGTIQTTGIRIDPITGAMTTTDPGNFGTASVNAAGQITGTTTVTVNGGMSGGLVSKGNLVNQITINGGFSGRIMAGGDLGVAQRDAATGNIAVTTAGPLALFGSVTINGGDSGTIAAGTVTNATTGASVGGNVYAAITINGGLNGSVGYSRNAILGGNVVSITPGSANGTYRIAFQVAGAQATIGTTSALTGTNASVSVTTTTAGTGSVGAVQTLTFGGSITGGTFRLMFNGLTTDPITWSANPATLIANIQAKLNGFNVGSVTGGQIVTLGNLVGPLTVNGGLSGLVAVQGDVGAIRLDQNGNAVVDSSNRLTRYGSVTVNGGVSGAVLVLGNVFSDLSINGGLSGRIAVQGKDEYGLNTHLTSTDLYSTANARVGILGRVTVNGQISSTGAMISGGVIGDDGLEYNPDYAAPTDSTGTVVTVSNNQGILAAAEDINGASNVANTSGFFQDVAYSSSNQNLLALDAIFSNLGQSGQSFQFNTPADGTTGLALMLGDLESLYLDSGHLAGTIQ
jgi:hypothetical protein